MPTDPTAATLHASDATEPMAEALAEMEPELHSRWTLLGIDPAQLVPDSTGTIGGHGLTTEIEARKTLAAISEEMPTLSSTDHVLVELGPILGEGGMGVVHLAEQPALRRQVAVKQLHPHARNEDSVGALLREAWVSGSLEHPNIVPIHALCRDGDAPQLVMKRIEGTSWAEVLDDPEAPKRYRMGDRLEWHIQVLVKLSHAVHFAHSRGVIHLDLKPENVMLGEFGEVYLLDWGLAASIRDDRAPWMPDARQIRNVVGTPAFMSPEQAGGEGEKFGFATDVYMLGAILHQIVTSRPLHDAYTPLGAILKAWKSEPHDYDEAVDPELVRIILRATAREPEERFQSAEEFREAVEAYLRHRSSAQLAREATERLDRLRPLLAGDTGSMSQVELADAMAQQRDVTECRFGLQQALRIWPENPEARVALQELCELVIRHALSERDWRRAAEMLEAMPEPSEELRAAVQALREELRAEREEVLELKAFKRQVDINTFRVRRVQFAIATAVLWIVWNVGLGYLNRAGILVVSYEVLLASVGVTGVIFVGGTWIVRRSLWTTALNRRAMGMLWAGILGVGVLWAGCWAYGVPLKQAIGLSSASYVTIMGAFIAGVDRRSWWITLALLPTVAVSFAKPDLVWEVAGFQGALCGLGLVYIWRKPADEESTRG